MARNGSGTYTNPYPDFVAGTVISSDQVDSNNADIATALTQSIAVDGQSTITANIPMATYKFTGLGAGSAATDSITLGQAQASAYTYQGTDSGAADAYVIALVPAITTQAAGLRVSFVAANASTGPSTLNAGGGTDAVEYQGAALGGAEIAAASTIVCEHDGTAWQMVSPSALLGTGSGTVTPSSTDTFTNKTLDANGTGNALSNIDIGNSIAASQAEAEAGTDNTKLVTCLRVAQAIGALGGSGSINQIQETPDGTLATGTTILPQDNTTPQNTEGDEYLAVTITPANASSTLLVEVLAQLGGSVSGGFLAGALFQDATADALKTSYVRLANNATTKDRLLISHKMAAGTISATTFKFRAGLSVAGTTTFNGQAATAYYNGTLNSFIRVTEVLP